VVEEVVEEVAAAWVAFATRDHRLRLSKRVV
jgi:hypothetical protein